MENPEDGSIVRCAGTCGLLIWSTNGRTICPQCIPKVMEETKARLKIEQDKIRIAANEIVVRTRGRIGILRAQVMVVLGSRCICCGLTAPEEILHIDHITSSTKTTRDAGPTFYQRILRMEDPRKTLQLLCNPCNSSKGSGPKCTLNHST